MNFIKFRYFSHVLCLAVLFTLRATSFAQVSFEAYTDAKEVLVNSYFEVTFTIKNANGVDFVPPSFSQFNILSGPNSSTSMQIINGQVSREMGYSYTLQPKKEGKLTIGSASIKANGKTLKTKTITIIVVKGNAANAKNDDQQGEAYVLIEPSKTQVYPGEQLLLDFKLYTTVSLDGYDITEEPDYKGFYVQELRRFNSRTQREVINGRQVTTKVLRRLALFPQQTGELTIPAARIQLALVEDNSRSGFFFRRNIKPIFIDTEPITISVKELPNGAPENFSGAVGQYQFQASVNRRQATTDDAISITMMIIGDGDLKRVQPPTLLLADSFEIYPPKVIEENINENQGRLVGRKVIEYLILPQFPGDYTIEPAISYFNTETESYEKMSAGPYQLFVKKGTDRHITQNRPVKKETAANDIRYIKRDTYLKKKGQYFIVSPIYLGAALLPFLAFIGLFIFRKSKRFSVELDSATLKTKQANKVALQRLSVANDFLQKKASRNFYDEISKASLGYVCDKLGIPLSELSKENVREKLVSLHVSAPLIEGYMKIIKTSEMAIYAGMDNAADMAETYQKAVDLIGKIEEEITAK
ncbi:MAG: BatD family protein [Bacteroidota bacterium]